jgi:hypothetical protein
MGPAMSRPLAPSFVAALAVLLLAGASAAAPPKKKKGRPDGPTAEGAIAGEVDRLACRAPDDVPAGAELVIECEQEKWLSDARIELHYRSGGQESYTTVTMEAVPKGPLRGKVPAEQVHAPYVLYYVQASIEGAGVVAAAGKPDSPTMIQVKAPPAVDPLARVAATATASAPPPDTFAGKLASLASGSARQPGSFWAGLSLGTGYGWSSRSRLEYRNDLEAGAGFGPAGLGHLAPEVGYQLTPEIAVALAGRHQYIAGGGGEPAFPGQPAHWAHAVLARGLYVVDHGFFSVHGAFQVGAGSGFRFRFSPDPVSGRPRHDTTRGGPVVFGPGAGAIFRLQPRLSLVAETALLLGVPDFALMTDVTLGVQVNL